MPYADPAKQRQAKRESARRLRATVLQEPVEPADVAPEPTREELRAAGAVLHVGRSPGESDDAYRSRIRQAWQGFLAVVAE
jgi:hypothetical protein